MKDLMIDRQKAIKLAADYLYNLMSPRCIGLTPDHCWKEAEDMLAKAQSAEPQYEELTPEEAASEIASGSTMSAWYWLDAMIRLKQMGYVICRKR